MIRILIGHRGSGKTSLLGRISEYFDGSVVTEDLDRLIEREAGKSVLKIFEEDGETRFRELEIAAFLRFYEEHRDAYLSVGAGFSGDFPADVEVIWVRRATDSVGRVFLDRPRLNSRVSSWQEYQERFPAREKRFASLADWIWTIPEGWDRVNEIEREFFLGGGRGPSGLQTVLPGKSALQFVERRLKWKSLRFELRDDLLSADEISEVLRRTSKDRLLYSFRRRASRESLDRIVSLGVASDWPLELGVPPIRPSIVSLHERAGSSVRACARTLEEFDAVSKLAIEIRDFDELLEGHEWAMGDPKKRAFLPRGEGGRWKWYRLWNHPRCPLSFLREGEGSASDQPLWFEIVQRQTLGSTHFAAILGDPVLQSRTPAEQFEFFKERGIPVLPIRISEEEWSQAISVLERLGLRYAAVTSPLKRKAAELCGSDFEAVNTIFFDGKKWIGTNTDSQGFEALMESVDPSGTLGVWGGGGTREIVREVLPNAKFYSARAGAEGERAPETLIWAVGRSRHAKWPPGDWRPKQVVDLNYSEDSPGREYALLTGAKYVSGLGMFKAQAIGQREFWKKEEKR